MFFSFVEEVISSEGHFVALDVGFGLYLLLADGLGFVVVLLDGYALFERGIGAEINIGFVVVT